MSLENAPDEVKLAVDLIMLLEENQVSAQTVLGALEIIKRDYENKLNRSGQTSDEAATRKPPARRKRGGALAAPAESYPIAGDGSSPLTSRLSSVTSSPFSLRRWTSSWLKAMLMSFSRHRRSIARFSSSTV